MNSPCKGPEAGKGLEGLGLGIQETERRLKHSRWGENCGRWGWRCRQKPDCEGLCKCEGQSPLDVVLLTLLATQLDYISQPSLQSGVVMWLCSSQWHLQWCHACCSFSNMVALEATRLGWWSHRWQGPEFLSHYSEACCPFIRITCLDFMDCLSLLELLWWNTPHKAIVGGFNKDIYFSLFWRLGRPRSGASPLAEGCLIAASSCGRGKREQERVSSSLFLEGH